MAATSVFVCYRRDDSGDVAGRIFDRLCGAFGEAAIFKDVDTIPYGVDFREHIQNSLGTARVVLVLIGPDWLDICDARERRRLDDPADHVRIEIEQALARSGLRVIPLLVRGAHMPPTEHLPEKLQQLAFRNAAEIRRDPDFHRDMDRLIHQLRPLLLAEETPALALPKGAVQHEEISPPVGEREAEKKSLPIGPGTARATLSQPVAPEKSGSPPAPKLAATSGKSPPVPVPFLAALCGQLGALLKFALAAAALAGLSFAIRYFSRKPTLPGIFPVVKMDPSTPAPIAGGGVTLPAAGYLTDSDLIKKLSPPVPNWQISPSLQQLLKRPRANSLGMQFVAVGDVQFGVHPVTVRDFQKFAEATRLPATEWKSPGFFQTPEHPVVNVSLSHATAFCNWLTDQERKGGELLATEKYRLPTEGEWNIAVGLPEGATIAQKAIAKYPWGPQWPPPEGAGNFAGEETLLKNRVTGYRDKFINTSPVGSFKANALGLYDLGGNVLQWTHPGLIASPLYQRLRGSSWASGSASELESTAGTLSFPADLRNTHGFRIVRATDGK